MLAQLLQAEIRVTRGGADGVQLFGLLDLSHARDQVAQADTARAPGVQRFTRQCVDAQVFPAASHAA